MDNNLLIDQIIGLTRNKKIKWKTDRPYGIIAFSTTLKNIYGTFYTAEYENINLFLAVTSDYNALSVTHMVYIKDSDLVDLLADIVIKVVSEEEADRAKNDALVNLAKIEKVFNL